MLDMGAAHIGTLPAPAMIWARAAEMADAARQLLGEMLCAWHRSCDQPADGTSRHPVFGSVSICRRCAELDGLAVTPFAPLRTGPNPSILTGYLAFNYRPG